jgi:hypothetical protein
MNVDHVWQSFSDQVNDVVSSFVPVFRVRESHDPAWLDSEARNLVKRKKTLYRKAKK